MMLDYRVNGICVSAIVQNADANTPVGNRSILWKKTSEMVKTYGAAVARATASFKSYSIIMSINEESQAMSEHLKELEELFEVALVFVEKHYNPTDMRDKGIKILATINQLIELKRLEQKG